MLAVMRKQQIKKATEWIACKAIMIIIIINLYYNVCILLTYHNKTYLSETHLAREFNS